MLGPVFTGCNHNGSSLNILGGHTYGFGCFQHNDNIWVIEMGCRGVISSIEYQLVKFPQNTRQWQVELNVLDI